MPPARAAAAMIGTGDPESPSQRIMCSDARPLEVWGVVTTVIRQLAL